MSIKNRTVDVDFYIFDVLMRDLVGHDHSPASFLVFLYLWRETLGRRNASAQRRLQQMAWATGLSKSAVQCALKVLKRRRLIRSLKPRMTAIPTYSLKKYWT